MAVLEYDTTGRIESGYFYEFTTTWTDRDEERARCNWFIHPPDEAWPPLSATAVTLAEDEIHECPHDPTHCTAKRPKKIELDLSDGIEHEFVPEMSLLLVTKSLEAKLRTSGLTGATFFKAEILPNEDVDPDLEIFAIYSTGLGSCLAQRILPESANQCFECGFSPLLCPACGRRKMECPRCGNQDCFVLLHESTGAEDSRIVITPTPDEGPIVDAAAWNGNDFFGGTSLFLTWRAVHFLSQIGARPFLAWPLRARLEGITEQQKQWLIRARTPICPRDSVR